MHDTVELSSTINTWTALEEYNGIGCSRRKSATYRRCPCGVGSAAVLQSDHDGRTPGLVLPPDDSDGAGMSQGRPRGPFHSQTSALSTHTRTRTHTHTRTHASVILRQ